MTKVIDFHDWHAHKLGYKSHEAFEDDHLDQFTDEYWNRQARTLGFESYEALAIVVDAEQGKAWEEEARKAGFPDFDTYLKAYQAGYDDFDAWIAHVFQTALETGKALDPDPPPEAA